MLEQTYRSPLRKYSGHITEAQNVIHPTLLFMIMIPLLIIFFTLAEYAQDMQEKRDLSSREIPLMMHDFYEANPMLSSQNFLTCTHLAYCKVVLIPLSTVHLFLSCNRREGGRGIVTNYEVIIKFY